MALHVCKVGKAVLDFLLDFVREAGLRDGIILYLSSTCIPHAPSSLLKAHEPALVALSASKLRMYFKTNGSWLEKIPLRYAVT